MRPDGSPMGRSSGGGGSGTGPVSTGSPRGASSRRTLVGALATSVGPEVCSAAANGRDDGPLGSTDLGSFLRAWRGSGLVKSDGISGIESSGAPCIGPDSSGGKSFIDLVACDGGAGRSSASGGLRGGSGRAGLTSARGGAGAGTDGRTAACEPVGALTAACDPVGALTAACDPVGALSAGGAGVGAPERRRGRGRRPERRRHRGRPAGIVFCAVSLPVG